MHFIRPATYAANGKLRLFPYGALYSDCLQKDNSNVIDQDHFTDWMVAFGFATEKKKATAY